MWLGNRLAGFAAAVGFGLCALPASALAPCFDGCHLNQGQPLYLVDAANLWVRRCMTTGGVAECVLERVDLDGRVLEKLPAPAGRHAREFESLHLRGHKVARLGHQTAWKELSQPYAHNPIGRPGLELRLELNTLVCTSPC